jgi:heptosyltransferase-1
MRIRKPLPDGSPHTVMVVRLGAMGDVLHALPAVACLKRSFPDCRLIWVIAPKWVPLLDANPYVDEILPFSRKRLHDLRRAVRTLRALKPDLAVDFQGLIQSAVVARLAQPRRLVGFGKKSARERLASRLYKTRVEPSATHVVDRNLELAATCGASLERIEFPIPAGVSEGQLPEGCFVLASPFAGWPGKQWPLNYYGHLAKLLAERQITLVANVAPERATELAGIPNLQTHVSSLAGLIDATRRAAGVVGLDSGPMHLAAALAKPGVALYGPTDPARNGPYGGTIRMLRAPGVQTSWKRTGEIHWSMQALEPRHVFHTLLEAMGIA